MIRVLWMPAFAGMTMLSTSSLATVDETPAYINALATYSESKVIDSSGLERIIEGCSTDQIAHPFTRESARTSTDKLLAFETLRDFINNAELEAALVCAWAKKTQAERQRQQEEREKTRKDTAETFEVEQQDVIAAGYDHACAIASNGTVHCWGDNHRAVPSDLDPVRSLSTGGAGTCAIKMDNTLVCWGDFTRVPSALGQVRIVSVGGYRICAVMANYGLACWSYDGFPSSTPSDLAEVRSVSAGIYHTCAVKLDNTVDCWPGSDSTPSDLGEVVEVSAGIYHTCTVKMDRTVECWIAGDPHSALGLKQINVPSDLEPVRSISVGYDHVCAIKMDGIVRCWGENKRGQLDIPPDLGEVRSLSADGGHTCAVKANGTVRCWGSMTYAPKGLCLLGFDCEGAKP